VIGPGNGVVGVEVEVEVNIGTEFEVIGVIGGIELEVGGVETGGGGGGSEPDPGDGAGPVQIAPLGQHP